MALGLKVMFILFAMVSLTVAIYVIPPDFMTTLQCLISPQACMSSGDTGFFGSHLTITIIGI
jgi:hypothetical protein